MQAGSNHVEHAGTPINRRIGVSWLPDIVADTKRGQHWRIYLPGLIFFYALMVVASQFQWFLSGAMWAEMATNYYPAADHKPLLDALLATDAGYLPLPQRLIAIMVDLLGLSPRAVPYVYQSAAFIAGGFLVAAFSHGIFRAIVPDDRVRALLCLMFCFSVDFAMTGFINFTYLGVLLTVPLVALAIQRDVAAPPWWAWFMPLLMLSKPINIVMLPALLLALIVAKPRFRAVLAVSLLAGIAQLIRLTISQASLGSNFMDPAATPASELATAVLSGMGALGGFTLGPAAIVVLSHISMWLMVAMGAVLTLVYAVIVVREWRRPPALLLVGGTLLYAVALMNSLALSRHWNLDLDMIRRLMVNRWAFGCIAGALFVTVAAMQRLTATPLWRARVGPTGPFPLVLVWFAVSLWPAIIPWTTAHAYPLTGNSYWAILSDRIGGTQPVCVPVDPYLFMYRRDCRLLNTPPALDGAARPLSPGGERVPLVADALDRPLLGFIVVAKPHAAGRVVVRATGKEQSGRSAVFIGARELRPEGGIVLLLPTTNRPAVLTTPLTIEAAPSVAVVRDPGGAPAVLQLGVDRSPAGSSR